MAPQTQTKAARRLDARIARRDHPHIYFREVAAGLVAAGIGATTSTFGADRRGDTDAYVELECGRDITWADAHRWREGWHLSSHGGRLAGGQSRRLLADIYADPAAVVEAARAALEDAR